MNHLEKIKTWLSKPQKRGKPSCPCGFIGGPRNIRQHRLLCPVWTDAEAWRKARRQDLIVTDPRRMKFEDLQEFHRDLHDFQEKTKAYNGADGIIASFAPGVLKMLNRLEFYRDCWWFVREEKEEEILDFAGCMVEIVAGQKQPWIFKREILLPGRPYSL